MDMTFLFQSYFIIHTMIRVMSPCELYHFRQILPVTYNWITIDIIKKKVIKLAKTKLKHILGDKYIKFIDILAKRNVIIYGPWVTQLFYKEDWDIHVELKMIFDYNNNDKNNNIFLDYANIDNLVEYDSSYFNRIKDYLHFEMVIDHIFNPYENIDNNIIKIYIYGDNSCISYHYQDLSLVDFLFSMLGLIMGWR